MCTPAQSDHHKTSWQKVVRWTRNLVKVSNRAGTDRTHTQQEKEHKMNGRHRLVLLAGILLFTAGMLLALSWDSLLDSQVTKEFVLTDTSKTYEPFRKSHVEVYIRFWFWNWTNPGQLREPGYKPILHECGPYSYREIVEKVNIIWNRNGTVTYNKRRRWYFDPHTSNGTEDDVITTLNAVANSAAFITRYDSFMTRKPLALLISKSQTIEISKSIRELLFEGYKSSLIDTAQTFRAFTSVKVPFDRFGWFYKRNGSSEADGVFNVETGANGMDHFGEIREWNYQNHTPFFDDECSQVRGSGGEFFPPRRTKQDTVELFSADLCRYVTFHYTKEEEIGGIQGLRYDMKSSMLDNGEEDPSNSCFCSGDCAPPGALNVSACRFGAPAFVSYPHFYMADSVYRNAVEGMNPDPAKHGSHITMEPKYAITLDVAARFQINILLQPFDDISLYAGVPTIYFPMLWFEQTAKIPSDTAAEVKTLLLLPTVGMSVAAILLVAGAALIAYVTVLRICTSAKQLQITEDQKQTAEPMIPQGVIRLQELEKEPNKWNTKL